MSRRRPSSGSAVCFFFARSQESDLKRAVIKQSHPSAVHQNSKKRAHAVNRHRKLGPDRSTRCATIRLQKTRPFCSYYQAPGPLTLAETLPAAPVVPSLKKARRQHTQDRFRFPILEKLTFPETYLRACGVPGLATPHAHRCATKR